VRRTRSGEPLIVYMKNFVSSQPHVNVFLAVMEQVRTYWYINAQRYLWKRISNFALIDKNS